METRLDGRVEMVLITQSWQLGVMGSGTTVRDLQFMCSGMDHSLETGSNVLAAPC